MAYFRGFIVWLIIISAEVVHGILRGLFLAPAVGDFRARQIAVFTGIIIIFTIAYYTVRWINSSRTSQLFIIGLIWLVLTLAFEILLGRFAAGFSWERIFSECCWGNILLSRILARKKHGKVLSEESAPHYLLVGFCKLVCRSNWVSFARSTSLFCLCS